MARRICNFWRRILTSLVLNVHNCVVSQCLHHLSDASLSLIQMMWLVEADVKLCACVFVCMHGLFCFSCCRVCLPPEPFLVVLFSTLHSKPEFYECVTVNGRRHLDFALSTCHDVIQLSRVYASFLLELLLAPDNIQSISIVMNMLTFNFIKPPLAIASSRLNALGLSICLPVAKF